MKTWDSMELTDNRKEVVALDYLFTLMVNLDIIRDIDYPYGVFRCIKYYFRNGESKWHRTP